MITFLGLFLAYDSENVDMVLGKLRFYQFDDISVRWFSSYLSGRTQRIKVNGQLSTALPRFVSVPQSSCLGPILFFIYTSDLKDHFSHCSLHSYVDDSHLLIRFKPAGAFGHVNTDLESVKKW